MQEVRSGCFEHITGRILELNIVSVSTKRVKGKFKINLISCTDFNEIDRRMLYKMKGKSHNVALFIFFFLSQDKICFICSN